MEEQLQQRKIQEEELRILEETKRKEERMREVADDKKRLEHNVASGIISERHPESIQSSFMEANANRGSGNLEENDPETEGNRKQPLFKASIGGVRSMRSQLQHPTTSGSDAEDLDGQCTPAGPIPKSKGGPVALMSLEIKPPSPQAAMSTTEESIEPTMDNSSALPKALEQALALKTERANEMGVHPEDIAQVFLLFLLTI